jgi:hypothetical protein
LDHFDYALATERRQMGIQKHARVAEMLVEWPAHLIAAPPHLVSTHDLILGAR